MHRLNATTRGLGISLPWLRLSRPSGKTLLGIGVMIGLVYIILVPIGVSIFSAFRVPPGVLPIEETARTGLDNFLHIIAGGRLLVTLWDTAIYVLGAVVLAFALAFSMAWLTERTDLPARTFFFVAILIPGVIPGLIHAQAWLSLIAPETGWFNQIIRTVLPFWNRGPLSPFSMTGMIVVQAIASVSTIYLLLTAVLRNMDASLEEASKAAGASMFKTLRRITMPLLMPSLVGVFILYTIITIGMFEIPLLFGLAAGVNIFSLRIWSALDPVGADLPFYGVAGAYGFVFLLITYCLFILYSRVNRQANKYATITGKGYRPSRLSLGPWKPLAIVYLMLFVVVSFLLPLLTLIWTSLLPFYQPLSWAALMEWGTLDSYRGVLADRSFWAGLTRSFIVAIGGATLAVFLSVIGAWVVVRSRRNIGTQALDLLATSPVAVPGAVIAFGFLLFYTITSSWLPLLGTLFILILAYAHRTAISYRMNYAGVMQINRELEEASATSGASVLSTLRRVVAPLLLPTTIVAWLNLFMLNMQEFTIAVFLTDASNRTLPIVIFNRIAATGGTADPAQAAAMSVLFVAVMICLVSVIRWYMVRTGAGGRGLG